jgi:hypothetical protein
MKRKGMNKYFLGGLTVILTGCVSTPYLPANVSTTAGGSTHINKMDYSYTPSTIVSFETLKVCAATVFRNDDFLLKDDARKSSEDFKYDYSQSHSFHVGGGNIFKLIDEKSNTIIASGNTRAKSQWGIINDIIKYDAKITLSHNRVGLIFQNLQYAQENTGDFPNPGFKPISTWSSSRASVAVGSIEHLVSDFKQCVNQ